MTEKTRKLISLAKNENRLVKVWANSDLHLELIEEGWHTHHLDGKTVYLQSEDSHA